MEHEGDNDNNLTSALDIRQKDLIKWLEGFKIRERAETTQSTALLRSERILRWVLETCCHLYVSKRQSAGAGVKNSQLIIMIIRRNKKNNIPQSLPEDQT